MSKVPYFILYGEIIEQTKCNGITKTNINLAIIKFDIVKAKAI